MYLYKLPDVADGDVTGFFVSSTVVGHGGVLSIDGFLGVGNRGGLIALGNTVGVVIIGGGTTVGDGIGGTANGTGGYSFTSCSISDGILLDLVSFDIALTSSF
jgi:hypothetical protein